MGFLKYPGNTKIQKHGQTGYKKKPYLKGMAFSYIAFYRIIQL